MEEVKRNENLLGIILRDSKYLAVDALPKKEEKNSSNRMTFQ